MVLAIFRRFRRLMATAVGEGGVVEKREDGASEFKVETRAPTAKTLFICVNASRALS